MKNLIFSILFILSAFAFAGDVAPQPLGHWIGLVNKDAKLSSIQALLGKPDDIKSNEGVAGYAWHGKIDSGKKTPDTLIFFVTPQKGTLVIVGIADPVSSKPMWFPWANKALPQ